MGSLRNLFRGDRRSKGAVLPEFALQIPLTADLTPTIGGRTGFDGDAGAGIAGRGA